MFFTWSIAKFNYFLGDSMRLPPIDVTVCVDMGQDIGFRIQGSGCGEKGCGFSYLSRHLIKPLRGLEH